MGGGPPTLDVVRSSCLLTFPASTNVEPVPVDAWYLHAVGLKFLRRLVRDRVQDPSLHVALVLQHQARTSDLLPRFVSISNDHVLQRELEQAFQEQHRVVLLHVVALTRVLDQKSIHVRLTGDPNVSPEPVAAMDFVLPVLPIAGIVQEEEEQEQEQEQTQEQMPVAVPLEQEKPSCGGGQDCKTKEQPWSSSSSMRAIDFSMAGAALMGAEVMELTAEIPLARVVSVEEQEQDQEQAQEHEREAASTARSAPMTDFVMLELQHGAGLEPMAMAADASSRFFISPNWYRDDTEEPPMLGQSLRTSITASASGSSSAATSSSASASTTGSSLADSFVVLDRDFHNALHRL